MAFVFLLLAITATPAAPATAFADEVAAQDNAAQNYAAQDRTAQGGVDPNGTMTEEEIRSSLGNLVLEPQSIHPDVLAQVQFDLGPLGQLGEELVQARIDLEDARARQSELGPQARELRGRTRGTNRLLSDAREVESATAEIRANADEALGEFAVATFVGFEQMDLDRLSAEIDVQAMAGIADESGDVVVQAALVARSNHDAAVAEVADLVEELADFNRQIETTDAAFDLAEEDEATASATLGELGPVLEAQLLGFTVPGTDIPVVVLDAYYKAELAFAQLYPACDVTWSHLAGIGKVESGHGSFGGSVVGADGRTSGRILGPQLNGDPFAAIPDTDGGRLDGDVVWDRAVGPMQFIPSSWAIFRHDGNGDGIADPHNIYDAAQAAADHLCRSTSGLGTRSNFQRALLGYNRSVEYGLTVMGFTDSYQRTIGLSSEAGGLAPGPAIYGGPLADPEPIEIINPDELPDPPGGDGGEPEIVIDNPDPGDDAGDGGDDAEAPTPTTVDGTTSSTPESSTPESSTPESSTPESSTVPDPTEAPATTSAPQEQAPTSAGAG